MTDQRNNQSGNIFYTREIGPRQAISLGLRASLPIIAFIALGPMVVDSGRQAPVALLLGAVIWLLTVLSYLELASFTDESGVHDTIASQRSGVVSFLAALALMLANVVVAALMARSIAELLLPFQEEFLPDLNPGLTVTVLAIGSVVVGMALALRRRQAGRRASYLVLLAGLGAVLLVIAGALAVKPSRAFLPPTDMADIFRAAAYPILILLAVEAVSEWKGNLRRGRGSRFPALVAYMLPILFLGALALLWAGLRIDPQGMAVRGLAGIVNELPFGWQLASLLFIITLANATGTVLLQANRLLRQLMREGYFPGAALANRRLSDVVVTVVSVAVLAALVLVLSQAVTTAIAIGLLLVYAGAINFAGIFYRPKEQGQLPEHVIQLPVPPLIPALGLAVTVFVAVTAETPAKLTIAILMAAATLIYLAYGRAAHDRADESRRFWQATQRACCRRPHLSRAGAAGIGQRAARALIDLAVMLAEGENGVVMPLEVVELAPQQTRAEGARIARERNQLLQWSIGERASPVPVIPLTRIGHNVSQAIIDTATDEGATMILTSWTQRRETDIDKSTGIVGELVRGAPCIVAAVNGDISGEVKRILVPTAGGPNAPVAAQLAMSFAKAHNASVVGFSAVRDENDAEAQSAAEETVRSTFAGLEGADDVEVRVVYNPKPIATILVEEASNGYDLVMLGASNEGMLDNILFGNVPERVAAEAPIPAIMVRAGQAASEAFLRLLWGRVQESAPVLTKEDQILVFRNLRRGARANINYYVLIVLSAIIATLGLWQNSAAVIIGAMLVAPLMTPILATSLGVVMGEPRTIRVAAESTLKGIVLGISIALFIALILPGEKIGSEILARTQPSLLDMAVALASGAAGAYALARKEVSAALPGVAIAAALMPPICTVGIGLAVFSGPIAGGAFLLFTTNLIAIIVAGTAVFLILGVRPRDDEEREQNFRRGLIVGIVMLLIVSVALALPTLRSRIDVGQTASVTNTLTSLADLEGVEIITVNRWHADGVTFVVARVSAPEGKITSTTVDAWSRQLAANEGSPVNLKVEVVPLVELQATSP
ncbi:MAG: DUF389 domain-containing protein [Caldilineales bacterium]